MTGDIFMPNRFEQLSSAIRTSNVAAATHAATAARREYLAAHDGLRDVVASTLEYIAGTNSPETAEALGLAAIEATMSAGEGEALQYSQGTLKERVIAVAAGWHWHATNFTLVEDDDKLTFRLDPCGSGMRLLLEGRYKAEGGWHRSVRRSPSTFMQTDFPLYSNHCAEMTRAALRSGTSTFIVEGWTPLRECGVCLQHTFKDTDAVPDEFYHRVGLPVPERHSRQRAERRERLFTPLELAEISTHPLERLVKHLRAGDTTAAESALSESLAAWRDAIHGAYRRWIGSLWTQVNVNFGPEALAKVIEATAPEYVAHVRAANANG